MTGPNDRSAEDVAIPGGRDVRATLDRTEDGNDAGGDDKRGDDDGGPDAIVVACPPHPQYGGSRTDARLVAVSEALVERGVDCLRIDYGEWDGGYGESTDADRAVGWALERYDRVGLFGFSFGGTIALATGAVRPRLVGVSALAPTARIAEEVDAVEAVGTIEAPIQIVYGARDSVADWEPVVERARERAAAGGDADLVEFGADHLFVGQYDRVGERVGEFFGERID
ncbi:MAG: dienelactone hydrolase family protein [Haloferacaceae archaeon]